MKIDHIAMYVNDLEAAKEFFIKYFNASANNVYHNKKTNFRSYFLCFDNGARLEIMNKPEMINIKIYPEPVIFILLFLLEAKKR